MFACTEHMWYLSQLPNIGEFPTFKWDVKEIGQLCIDDWNSYLKDFITNLTRTTCFTNVKFGQQLQTPDDLFSVSLNDNGSLFQILFRVFKKTTPERLTRDLDQSE